MLANFTVKIASTPSSAYDALLKISQGFISELKNYISPFGYTIITTETIGGVTRSTHTTQAEAQKIKKFCYDFWIEKDGRPSRNYRIESPLAINTLPLIGVLGVQPSKKKTEFRSLSLLKHGRSNFLNDYRQSLVHGNYSIRWNGKINISVAKTYYFSLIVNDEILLVHGGREARQSDACVYANYISFIKCYHLFKKIDYYIWLCNGVYGFNDTGVVIDIPLNTKTKELYSKMGIQLKIRYSKDPEFEYGSAKIMVISSVSNLAFPPENEEYRVLFENLFVRSANVMRVMSTLPGITTKMATISVF